MVKERDEAVKERGKIDIAKLVEVNGKVIKIQSWMRMKLVRKRLERDKEKLKKIREGGKDGAKELMGEFYKALKSRKITPEEFIRALD